MNRVRQALAGKPGWVGVGLGLVSLLGIVTLPACLGGGTTPTVNCRTFVVNVAGCNMARTTYGCAGSQFLANPDAQGYNCILTACTNCPPDSP